MTNGTSDFYFPPFRFAAVEDNVFRGALPKPRNLSFISTLNLTTLIACIPEPMPDHISEFADHNNISLVFFKTEKPKEHIPLSFPKVLQILQLLCDSTQIIYLHCLDGVLVTSMIIMGLRKLQGWSSDAYMNEACRFLRDGMLSVQESEFIEKLTGEFEIPLNIPKWLWGGAPVLKHSYFKIKNSASLKSNKLLPSSSQFESPLTVESESVRVSLTQLEIEKEDLRRYVSKAELKQVYVEEQDEEAKASPVSRTLEALDLEVSNLKLVIGVCAMDSKARSKPMREILDRLISNDEFEVLIFGDKVILDEDVGSWPACDFLISFHSKGFPLTKAIEYVKMREPICINDLLMQPLLWDRRLVLQVLDKAGVPTPNRIISNVGNDYPQFSTDMLQKIAQVGIELVQEPSVVEQVDADTIQLGSSILKKPFVEKPVNGDDHNVYLYYSSSQGGGVRRMFRKVGNKSSLFCPDEWQIRSGSSFIYEEFLESTNSEDVKVYTIGEDFAHAETRKSPVVDGLVRRNANGKEIRYVISLTDEEFKIAKSVSNIFKQAICGFDLLRTDGKSFVIDVNGWSFVKGNEFYYEQCARIFKSMFLDASSAKGEMVELGSPIEQWKLKGYFSVMRHGDRTPKQKMKFFFSSKEFFAFLDESKDEVVIKRSEKLREVLHACVRAIEENIDDQHSLSQLKMILEAKMNLPGTKIQLRRNSKMIDVGLQCIVKWGGEFTHSGLYHSRDLAQNLRKDLSIINKNLLEDIKVFTSSERRVIATADTFCKAFLNTHDIAPDFIKVSKEMLDDSNAAKDSLSHVKDRLRDILNPETETIIPDNIIIPPEMNNPSEDLQGLIDILAELRGIMRTNFENMDVTKVQTRWCCSESPDLFKERWEKLFRDFCDVERSHFDTSKLSELHDSLKYDFLHNRTFIQTIFRSDKSDANILRTLYNKSKLFFSCFGPHEYGISKKEKLEIGMLNSLHLLKQLIEEITFARDADKPCSRFFFTKESKIMCLLNIVLLCGLKCHVTPAEIKELDYLTQIVFELYERKGGENEYSLRIEFSPGAHYWNLIDLELDSKHALSAAPKFFISDHIPLEEALSHLRPKLPTSGTLTPLNMGFVDDEGLFLSISPETVRRHLD